MTGIRRYRNAGVIVCDAVTTEYLINPGTLAKAFGLTSPVPMDAHDAAGGWNQITIYVAGGSSAWTLEADLVGNGVWAPIAAPLTQGASLVSVGPRHPGVYENGSFANPLPSFTAAAYKVILVLADAAARIQIVAQAF